LLDGGLGLQQQRNHHRGKGTKEPDLKKRKKNEEQEPTPPVVDANGATVGADKHDASDQPAVLSEPVAAGGGGGEARSSFSLSQPNCLMIGETMDASLSQVVFRLLQPRPVHWVSM